MGLHKAKEQWESESEPFTFITSSKKLWSLSQREALPQVAFINMALRNDLGKDKSWIYIVKKTKTYSGPEELGKIIFLNCSYRCV